MHWVCLALAILFELCGTTAMKLSDGFTKTLPSICMFMSYLACFGAMTIVVKKIEVSISYAIWSGMGTALVALIGIVYFHETVTMLKIVSTTLVIAGVVGLSVTGVRM
jgi:small multidrug resistance pump